MRSEKRAIARDTVSYRIGQFLVQLSDRRSTRLLFSSTLGAIAGVILVLAHASLVSSFTASEIALAGDAFIVASFVFLLTLVELSAVRERRGRVLRDMRVVADLNHHVRNALSAIQYAAYTSKDQSNLAIITSSIERIDRILKELFPVMGESTKPTRRA